jgi:hypothetical protein
MGHRPHPADDLITVEDRREALNVRGVRVTNERIIVAENVAGIEAGIVFVVVLDHPFDGHAHGMDVHDDPCGKHDRVAIGRIQGEAQLAELLHDG